MKIAVTGASGHVGNMICRKLIEKGHEVRVLVHKKEDDLKTIGVEIFIGNILDQLAVNKFVKDCEIVFHLAAIISIDNKDRDHVFKTNVEGVNNIIEACKANHIKRLIHFSTIHTIKVENINAVLDESNPIMENSKIAYEASKAEGQKLVNQASKEGLNAVIINPTAIIGPYDFKPSYLGQALIKIFKNQLPMLVEGGYDFVDVRDVADGAILAMEKGRAGEQYILGGAWFSLKEISQHISAISGSKTPTKVVSPFVARLGLPFIHFWSKLTSQHPLYTSESLDILRDSSRNISHKKAKDELGYNPRQINETLFDTFEWFKKQRMI